MSYSLPCDTSTSHTQIGKSHFETEPFFLHIKICDAEIITSVEVSLREGLRIMVVIVITIIINAIINSFKPHEEYS